MAAQPLTDRQADREREQARRIPGPQQARQRKAERTEQGETGRKPQHRERHQPGEGRCIDQEGVADPVKPRHEIAESEPETRHRRRRHAAPSPGSGAVDQPDRDRKGHKQHRPCIERRHRQRRQGAGDQRNRGALPSPGQDDRKTRSAEFVGGCHCEPAPSPGGGALSSACGVLPSGEASRRRLSRGGRAAGRSLRMAMGRALTPRGSASSTSISKLPGPEITSPRTGSRPTCDTRYPPSVATSSPASPVMKSSPITERASSRLARASATKELSACRTIAGGSSLSCSSSISPTICSTMSSIETSPSVPPYSSTTSARWIREACICANRSIARIDGGTYNSLRMMLASESGRARPTARKSRPAGKAFLRLALLVSETRAVAVMNARRSRMWTMPSGSSRVSL